MFDQIKNDLLNTMKSGDKFRLDVIKMLKSAIQMETIEAKKDLTDDEVIAVIKREVKKRNSSIEEYTKYGKTEMVESLKKEVDILSEYLPASLSAEEVEKVIDEVIKEVGATSIKDMGTVIKKVGAKIGTQTDMGTVSEIVKEKLV